jgi:4-amino-4-deoxy-L-arabinose transferase-like glycosyltransferase
VGVVELALALVGLVAIGAGAAAALRLTSFVSFALATYLVCCGTVVALAEALSTLDWIGKRGYALGELLLLAAVGAAWHVRGRPRPPLPAVALGRAARSHPLLCVLAAVVGVAGVYAAFIGIATPPNNGDSLGYHLTSAAAWLQHGGIHELPGSGKARENEFPPNAELEILYTFVFLGRDSAAALTQLVAEAAIALAIYGAARRLRFDAPAALFAALLFPTLSVVALESVTTQNDLVVASFVAAAAYFVHARDRADPWLGGLAVGLALGTKLSAIFALPVLLLFALTSLRGRALATAVAAATVAFLAFGSFVYARNLFESGGPVGTFSDPKQWRAVITARGTVSTMARYSYGFLDLPGYPFDYRDLRLPTAVARNAFEALHIPPNPPESTAYPFGFAINVRANEDLAYFGPLGVLLVLPLSVAFTIAWISRSTTAERGMHAVALPLYLLTLALAFRYSGQGRYLITPVALTLPLAATIYRWRWITAAVTAVAAVTVFFAYAHDETKPTGLRGTTPVWRLSRAQAQGLQAAAAVSYMIERLEAEVPEDALIGTVVGESDADYVLYGPALRRRPVALPRRDPLAAAERLGLRWVYLGRFVPVPGARAGWTTLRLSDSGTLLIRR